jgi:hypothetical protein
MLNFTGIINLFLLAFLLGGAVWTCFAKPHPSLKKAPPSPNGEGDNKDKNNKLFNEFGAHGV